MSKPIDTFNDSRALVVFEVAKTFVNSWTLSSFHIIFEILDTIGVLAFSGKFVIVS